MKSFPSSSVRTKPSRQRYPLIAGWCLENWVSSFSFGSNAAVADWKILEEQTKEFNLQIRCQSFRAITITEHQPHTQYLHSIKTRKLQERKSFDSFCLRAERSTWSMALTKQANRLSDIELLECRPELIDGIDEDDIRIDINHSIDIQNTLDEDKNSNHRSHRDSHR